MTAARMRRRAVVELLVAVAAAAGCVLSWLSAQSIVAVEPVLPGEPASTSVSYSPPLLALALVCATVAGVLVVVGTARLLRRGAYR